MTYPQMAEHLAHSPGATKEKAVYLSLTQPPKPWTPADEQYVIDHYPHSSNAQLAGQLGFSVRAVAAPIGSLRRQGRINRKRAARKDAGTRRGDGAAK